MLVNKLSTVKELSEDLAHYYRQHEDHPDKSYQFLRNCVNRCLELRQQKQNREGMTKSLTGQQNYLLQQSTAASAQGKKKGGQEAQPKAAFEGCG